ncbi:hypothetical protein F4779DRAFT_526671 [Xylariaceae sp. FL0662B]|nr:hypothetical protein F4779DRAFT_526671 [Xylariaceae sp. FL0662B]
MAISTAGSKKYGVIAFLVLALIWSIKLLFHGSSLLEQSLNFNLGLPMRRGGRPLILYAYKESENARQNLQFFLDQGLHGAADFLFILNGETDAADLIPNNSNIQIIRRPNMCFDLGAFGEVLRQDDLWKKYKRFITMNASLRGPFLPYWSTQCWSDAYLGRVTEDVKLVGMTVNCSPSPHVQSMIWATDSVGMELLLYPPAEASQEDAYGTENDTVAFGGCYEVFPQAIHAEIGATRAIRNAGYEVSAMMSAFQGEEYFGECDQHPADVLYNGQYFGTNVHPYETIFFKANRGVDPTTLDLLTRVHMSTHEGRSWDLCK